MIFDFMKKRTKIVEYRKWICSVIEGFQQGKEYSWPIVYGALLSKDRKIVGLAASAIAQKMR